MRSDMDDQDSDSDIKSRLLSPNDMDEYMDDQNYNSNNNLSFRKSKGSNRSGGSSTGSSSLTYESSRLQTHYWFLF